VVDPMLDDIFFIERTNARISGSECLAACIKNDGGGMLSVLNSRHMALLLLLLAGNRAAAG
jgi:hypothetical protein